MEAVEKIRAEEELGSSWIQMRWELVHDQCPWSGKMQNREFKYLGKFKKAAL